jgi:hypothetical protein
MNNKCSYAHIRGIQKWTPLVYFSYPSTTKSNLPVFGSMTKP